MLENLFKATSAGPS